MSQTGDFMDAFSPGGSLLCFFASGPATLALMDGQAKRVSLAAILRAGAARGTHSVRQKKPVP
jgi:hypothetical protein